MVDALREAWRVLVADGLLIDLRPLASLGSPLEIVAGDEAVQVGEVDEPGTVADDLAADHAAAQVVGSGCYRLAKTAHFEFEFSWDTVGEMASFVAGSRRMGGVSPSYSDLERTHRAWCARARGRVRLRYRRKMLLTVYRKLARP